MTRTPVTVLISWAAHTKMKEVTRRLNIGWFGTRTRTPAVQIGSKEGLDEKMIALSLCTVLDAKSRNSRHGPDYGPSDVFFDLLHPTQRLEKIKIKSSKC